MSEANAARRLAQTTIFYKKKVFQRLHFKRITQYLYIVILFIMQKTVLIQPILLKLLVSLLLISSASSCKLFQGGSGNNIRTDTIIVRKTDPVKVVKVDTFRNCDTLPPRDYVRLIVCTERVGGTVTRCDTTGRIELTAQRKADSLRIVQAEQQRDSLALAELRKPQLKSSYKVVIMLPFMVGDRSAGNEAKATRAVEFYEGAQMAFDSLRRENVPLSISVFDTQDSDSVLQTLLLREEVRTADLIIGPMSNSELRTVSDFAAANKIPMVSPLNPRFSPEIDHDYFLQMSPSYEQQSAQIFAYAERRAARRPKNFVIIGTKDDSLLMEQFQTAYGIYRNDPTARAEMYMSEDGRFDANKIKTKTKSGALNILVAPTLREPFVFGLLRSLSGDGGKPIDPNNKKVQDSYIVFGLSQWKYFETINFEYFENMRMHMTSDAFADLKNPPTTRFKEAYYSEYGMPPREFAYVGFDVMIYVGRMLKKHGTGFFAQLDREPYTGRACRFEIKPIYRTYKTLELNGDIQQKTVVKRYENTFIHILKFEEFKIIKAE